MGYTIVFFFIDKIRERNYLILVPVNKELKKKSKKIGSARKKFSTKCTSEAIRKKETSFIYKKKYFIILYFFFVYNGLSFFFF